MVKYFLLSLNLLVLFTYKFLFDDRVSITQSVPSNVKSGTEFTIEMVINKGDIIGFAKLQQNLPDGFTATVIDSKGASFTFNNKIVKLIWTSLPAENTFKISYKVAVASDAPSGQEFLGGTFAYVFDNIKQSIEIPEVAINIDGINNKPIIVEPTNPVNIKPVSDTATVAEKTELKANSDNPIPPQPASEIVNENKVVSSAKTFQSVACTRKIHADASSGDYIIEVSVEKGSLSGFAKLQESIPQGLNATEIENSGSSFTFSDQKVKFVWIFLPSQSQFTISYKISASNNVYGSQTLDGLFSYIENDETKKYALLSDTIFLKQAAIETSRTIPLTRLIRVPERNFFAD